MKKKLIVVTTEPFPIGMAATNRMLSYLVHLVNYCDIEVFITKPTEIKRDVKNSNISGEYKGLKYSYISKQVIWPKDENKVKKAILLAKSYFFLTKELLTPPPDSVLVISNNLFLIHHIQFLSYFLKYKMFQEKSEFPPVLKQAKINKFYKQLYLKVYEKFDGMIVMTKELEKYFKSIKQKNIFLLPMSIEINRFKLINKTSSPENFIFKYCGGGNYERDGLLLIIESFIECHKKFKNFEFHVIGPIAKDSRYLKQIFDLIDYNNAKEYIKFLGVKNSDLVPKLLIDADALIMAPTRNFDSGGFPTKLGEFLATGNPVICTSVSEIPDYLNQTNALLVEPNNKIELLNAIERVITKYQECRKIGINGRKTAYKFFNAESYAFQLCKFLGL